MQRQVWYHMYEQMFFCRGGLEAVKRGKEKRGDENSLRRSSGIFTFVFSKMNL